MTIKDVSTQENHMNEIELNELSKYLDLKYMHVRPDSKSLDKNQVAELEKDDFDSDNEIPEKVTPKASALVPREYQYELYQKALLENVIVVLDTGMGKTLISTTLIKQLVYDEKQARLKRSKRIKNKLVFFIVERVPLVFQQASVINANCNARVKELCGEMNVDKMSGDVWNDIFDSNDIIVLTAQVLVDCFYRGFITIDRAHLLIFDECHHATKKHPFNVIMQEFYFKCAKDQRPKIFGMTASPVAGQKNVEKSIMKLEKNLDSRVYTASNLEELNVLMNRPKETLSYYNRAPNYQKTALTQKLKYVLQPYEHYKRCFIDAKQTLMDLGPWCADKMWKVILYSLERRVESNIQGPGTINMNSLKKAIQITDEYQVNKTPDISNTSTFSPKTKKLIEVLKESVESLETFRGIIFVDRRLIAIAIHRLIVSLDCFKDLKTGILLGHGKGADDYIKMNYKHQNRVVDDFRKGDIDLLIATNVAEEGLDIQPCNVVIRFDFVKTVIAYIQSRGRARKKGSRYIIMLENDNPDQMKLLSHFTMSEQRMKDFCQIIPSKRNVANAFLTDNKFDESKVIQIPETGAKLTEQNAVALIYQYCSSLPRDEFCAPKPIFKQTVLSSLHKCHLTLPNNAVIREVESSYLPSEDKARVDAAFQACALLIEKGGLDEHLRPRNWKSKAAALSQNDKNGSRRQLLNYKRIVPAVWTNKDVRSSETGTESLPLWLTIIVIALPGNLRIPTRKLCLITNKQIPTLPSLKLFHDGTAFTVFLKNAKEHVRFDSNNMALLSKYMPKLLEGLLNKPFACSYLPYRVVPFIKDCTVEQLAMSTGPSLEKWIDWKEIKSIADSKNQNLDLQSSEYLKDSIVVDKLTHCQLYSVENVGLERGPANNANGDISMLQVEKLNRTLNFLNPYELQKKKSKGEAVTWDSSSSFERFFISLSVYHSMKMVPSIMTRIDSFMLVHELKCRYDLNIKDSNLLEACTTPSANMEMNYERLEILGDSVLKIISSTCLFIKNPFSDENELNYLRTRIISNNALYNIANRQELYSYVTSHAFTHRHWRPPGFTSPVDGQTISDLENHKLSDKTMADILEALLGAAYLEHGLEGGFDTAIQLNMPFDDIDMSNYFQTIKDEMETPDSIKALNEVSSSIDVKTIEEIVGRKFKRPLLVAEALTHASFPVTTITCYQRLEFLGDAVLDILATRYLYRKYPEADPGTITSLKKVYVNNKVLSIICIEIGLYKHIRHCSGTLVNAMNDFVKEVDDKKATGNVIGQYWADFNAPKVLADVVESVLGATFVDSNFQLDHCEKLFEKWFVPMINGHVSLDSIQLDPLSKLIDMLQKNSCNSFMLRNYTTQDIGANSQNCVVFFHGRPLASGSDWNVKSARRKAASNAIKRLNYYPTLLSSTCTCEDSETDNEALFL